MARKKAGCLMTIVALPFAIIGGVLKLFLLVVNSKKPGRRNARGRKIKGYKY
jgi:hypothetical protein